jgi:nucleotide-binding universal stress UspA family protein
MYKKILIPLDNSRTDDAIINHVRPLAKLTGAQLVLVRVAEGFAARLQDELNLEDSQEIKSNEMNLENLRGQLAADGFKVKALLVKGIDPAQGILKVAEDEGCDLIAMSTHGHKFIQDIILGSVADKLRHQTDIPILMIRSTS